MEVDNKVEFGWHLYTYLLKIQNSKKRNYSILKIKSGVSSSIILVKTLMVFHHWKHQFRFRSFSASVIWKMEFANSVTINKYLPGTNVHANTHKTVFVFNIVRLAHAQKSPLVPGDVRSSPPDWRLPAPGPELSSGSVCSRLLMGKRCQDRENSRPQGPGMPSNENCSKTLYPQIVQIIFLHFYKQRSPLIAA